MLFNIKNASEIQVTVNVLHCFLSHLEETTTVHICVGSF